MEGRMVIVKKKVILSMIISILLMAAGCQSQADKNKTSNQGKNGKEKTAVNFRIVSAKSQKVGQIRGIGYPGNDDALYVATNDGIKFFKDSKWLETTANKHHLMSLQAINNGFLASGHPQKGMGFKDPMGIVESNDQGKSFHQLGFYGEGNFHFLSASFFGNGMYMIMEQPTGQLDPGVYYSKNNNGENWMKSKLAGFTANSLGMIAVHPKNGNIMAMSTKTGIFYSENYSNTMNAITGPIMVTALAFKGDDILYSSVEDQKILLKEINPKTGETKDISIPFLDYDNPVTYITSDPKNENKLAFATYKDDLYESTDGGESWKNILADGRIEQE
jgi:hypothetical protein